jgi:hypothetical protein
MPDKPGFSDRPLDRAFATKGLPDLQEIGVRSRNASKLLSPDFLAFSALSFSDKHGHFQHSLPRLRGEVVGR